MLKRAAISMVIACVAALWGYGGLLDGTAPLAQLLFIISAGFCLLSLLFSLFEPNSEPRPIKNWLPHGSDQTGR
jgi:uncharacterized membrane protein YtjA (UPF0391 family)